MTMMNPIVSRFPGPFVRARLFSSRRIPVPTSSSSHPFPVVPECPEPTCSCAETPSGLDIDHKQDLNGTMAPYSQQVLIATGQGDWRSRIEEDGMDEGWGMLARGLKGLVGRGGKFADPYNNIMITNSSFSPSPLGSTAMSTSNGNKTASAFLFPAFRYVPNIQLDDDTLTKFVQAFLLPREVHTAHDILPAEKKKAMQRVPELQSAFPEVLKLQYSPTILICGHGHRDQRCGIFGPILQAEFRRALERVGFSVDGTQVDAPGQANVALISHIGGHKYAGNVIIYLPPSLGLDTDGNGTRNNLAGKGIWYGRVEPRHVEGIVLETILKGKVIVNHFRGGINEESGILRL